MKIWLATAISLVLFSGCSIRSSSYALQNQNARQALLIQKQKAKIAELTATIKAMKKRKRKRKVSNFVIPTSPKKDIKLKKVEDDNYSSGYMYPETKKKKPVQRETVATTTNVNATMDRATCIAMIGQAKFDKYTQMFGGEAGSIKRCKMLRAMR